MGVVKQEDTYKRVRVGLLVARRSVVVEVEAGERMGTSSRRRHHHRGESGQRRKEEEEEEEE